MTNKTEYLYVALLTKKNKELNTTEYERQRVKLQYSIEGAYNVESIRFPINEGKEYTLTHIALVNNSRKLFYDKIYEIAPLDKGVKVRTGEIFEISIKDFNITFYGDSHG